VPEHTSDAVALVFGPGAALAPTTCSGMDTPKRCAKAAVAAGTTRDLGQGDDDGPPTTKRLFYIDWPLLDRHRDSLANRIDCWIDCQDLAAPAGLSDPCFAGQGGTWRPRCPVTRPTFNTTSWGGRWAQEKLGLNQDAPNTALGYELIAPESGVLIGDAEAAVEVPLQMLVALSPRELLGARVHGVFGTSFVYLGLRGDADLEAFRRVAHEAHHHEAPFDIESYVQTFPAEPHQLFVTPAGTPEGSGEGNAVLEVSATPYLYSLRFYDWLRRDVEGRQRPIHLGHAFDNLAPDRTGEAVRRVKKTPGDLRSGSFCLVKARASGRSRTGDHALTRNTDTPAHMASAEVDGVGRMPAAVRRCRRCRHRCRWPSPCRHRECRTRRGRTRGSQRSRSRYSPRPATALASWHHVAWYKSKAECIDVGQQYEREGWPYACLPLVRRNLGNRELAVAT
jgi:hypothetical protein